MPVAREESELHYRITKNLFKYYKNDDRFYFWFSRYGSLFDSVDLINAAYLAEAPGFRLSPNERYRARTVDLSNDAVLDRPNGDLCIVCPWLVTPKTVPTEFGVRVLQLRKGDRVVFADRKILLGEFLGRGNASHVFAVEGDDENILKIPLGAGNIHRKSPRAGWIYSRQVARSFLMGSVETLKMLPEYFAHVRVTDHGKNYEWALIKKIPGDEDGGTFLRTLGPNPNKLQLAKRDRLRANVARYIQLGHNVGRAQSLDPKNENDIYNTARQLMWDGADWPLIDWD